MHNNGDIMVAQRQGDVVALPGDVIRAKLCGPPPPSSFSHHVPVLSSVPHASSFLSHCSGGRRR